MIKGTSKEALGEVAFQFWAQSLGFVRWVLQTAFSLVEFLLLLRLILFYLGANPEALIVRWIYKIVWVINFPYHNIFGVYSWNDRLIDLTTVASIIGYALSVAIIFSILDYMAPQNRVHVPTRYY